MKQAGGIGLTFYKPISMQIKTSQSEEVNFILISAIITNIAILEATVRSQNFCSDLDSLQKMGLDTG